METEKDKSILKPIVLKELIAEKNSRLAARLPWFVYSLMNRLLHIREINEIIMKYGHLNGIPFIEAVLQYFDVKWYIVELKIFLISENSSSHQTIH